MKILNPEFNLEAFWRKVQRATKRLLLLDYDGTLAPFRVERDRAIPYPGVREIIRQLLKEPDLKIIIISGRQAEEVVELLGLKHHPEIWGVHGMERLSEKDELSSLTLSPRAEKALEQAAEKAESLGLAKTMEKKSVSIAFHTRNMNKSETDKINNIVTLKIFPITAGTGMELHPFDGGLEIRSGAVNKGDAVNTIFEELGNDKDVAAAYLGDDFTDEDAFLAIKGRGAAVLVRDELRKTAADLWIRPPDELLEFLSRWKKRSTR